MQQSEYGNEMAELMDLAEEFAISEKKGIDKDDVHQAAMKTAKEIWGDEVDEDKVEKMAMDACKKSDSTAEAIEMVQNMMQSNEAKQMGYSGQAIETSGPGSKKRNTRNDYTREEVAQMLQYATKFAKDGKRVKSWKYSQDWLNKVGDSMRQFINLKSGDPALDYEEGTMQGQASEWGYSPNKYGKAKEDAQAKGQGPGPQRGSKMDTSISNKKHGLSDKAKRSRSRKTRTDYNQ